MADGIVTVEELRRREEVRAKPKAVPSLSPRGIEMVEALRRADNTNEQRIAYLRGRLGAAGDRLRLDRAKAQTAKIAKMGFERSR